MNLRLQADISETVLLRPSTLSPNHIAYISLTTAIKEYWAGGILAPMKKKRES